jgi:hypothetical protein
VPRQRCTSRQASRPAIALAESYWNGRYRCICDLPNAAGKVAFWPIFPVHSHALVVDPAGGEWRVTAQTQKFSQALYNESLNEKQRPAPAIHANFLNGNYREKRTFKLFGSVNIVSHIASGGGSGCFSCG